jgi:5-formyltetrahydrofolate cyclo-ligase
VLLFAPIANARIAEVDLSYLAVQCASAGAPLLYVPRVDWEANRMIPTIIHRWHEDLVPGPRGVCEPPATAETSDPGEIDLILLPGLAFDGGGGRLGRGGGFYDRFLADPSLRAVMVGVCFDRQIVDTPLPTESHDIPVHLVVSESRTILTGENV